MLKGEPITASAYAHRHYTASLSYCILARAVGSLDTPYIETFRVPFVWNARQHLAPSLPGALTDVSLHLAAAHLCIYVCICDPDALLLLLLLLGNLPDPASPLWPRESRARARLNEQTCSIPSSLLSACARLVPTPTALGNPHALQAHGASPRAMPVSSAGDGRSAAMAPSPVDSANGISILR
jgi:hypothetical protein